MVETPRFRRRKIVAVPEGDKTPPTEVGGLRMKRAAGSTNNEEREPVQIRGLLNLRPEAVLTAMLLTELGHIVGM